MRRLRRHPGLLSDLRDRQPIADHRQHGLEAACPACWLTQLFTSTAAYGRSTSDRRGEHLNNGCRVCTNSPNRTFYLGESRISRNTVRHHPMTKCPASAGSYKSLSTPPHAKNQGYLPEWHEKSRSGYLDNRLFKILIIGKVDRFFPGQVQELLECFEFMFLGSRVIIKFIKYDHTA
jgi:hypothetical protein